MKKKAISDCSGMGGDKHAYLGHFRSPKVLERGHNVGAPKPMTQENAGGFGTPAPALEGGGGMRPPRATPSMESGGGLGAPKKMQPQFNATTNPIAATRQANRASLSAAKASGGNIGQVRAQNRAAMSGAKTMRKERNAAGLKSSDMAAFKGAKQAAKAAPAPATPKQTAMGVAKAGLQSAVGGVRAARQGLRSAIRGGNVAGAGSAFGALQTAKAAKQTAKVGVKTAKRGRVMA